MLPCIRLLKPFDLKAFSSKDNRVNNEETESERNSRGAKRGQITEQVAELSINRQIYDTIKLGGAEGVSVTEVHSCEKHLPSIVYSLHHKEVSCVLWMLFFLSFL